MPSTRSMRRCQFAGSLSLLLLALSWSCKSEQPKTDIMLTITSAKPVDKLELRALDYLRLEESITRPVDRDITVEGEGYILLMRPTAKINGKFLIHVKGFSAGRVVTANSAFLEFTKDQEVQASLRLLGPTDFIDADGDSFPACTAGKQGELCDCRDQDAKVRPFQHEICDDKIDNNCNGDWRDECRCVEDAVCTKLDADLAAALAGIGACKLGRRPCVDGVLAADCLDSGEWRNEVPGNFIDDDCDGNVDEGSPCLRGKVRACHRGFVDDDANPDEDMRREASNLARGECSKPGTQHEPRGQQACLSDGTWGFCEGDVQPQRDVPPNLGWVELQATQCDGLDNDCDGRFDEEAYFDSDGDGYTICGTVYADPPFTVGGVSEAFIDCNDAKNSGEAIHPGMTESCVNTGDQDCRCDHDPADRPASDPLSAIGKPYNRVGGGLNCEEAQMNLVCSQLPRSDTHPTGLCSDTEPPGVYYRGYFDDEAMSPKMGCYTCGETYGLGCSPTTEACTGKNADCDPCDQSGAPTATERVASRPVCKEPVAGSCSGLRGPEWRDLSESDPYGECEHGWKCRGTPAACAMRCGDSLKAAAEACDDGNPTNADGCSSACTIEPGYSCAGEPSLCLLNNGGATCDADGDCMSGHCDLNNGVNPETGRCCVAGDCCSVDPACASGWYCRNSTWQCVTGDVGSACDDNTDCDSTNHCQSSVCVADVVAGSSGCDEDVDCATGHCDLSNAIHPETGRCCAAGDCCAANTACAAGSYCRASSWQCVMGDTSSACDDNGDCDAANYCQAGICAGDIINGLPGCDEDSDCLNNHCDMSTSPHPATGRCCALGADCCDADSDCAAGWHCRNPIWQCVTGDVGSGCADSGDCDTGLFCSDNLCASVLANGSTTCGANANCASGHCDLSSFPHPERWRCCASGADCCDSDFDCASSWHCRNSVWQCVTGDVGAVCDNNTDCDSANYCLAGSTCVVDLAIGATGCDENGDCTSGYCDMSTVPGLETGRCCAGVAECCDADDDCGGSYCRGSTWQCVSGAVGAGCDNDTDCAAANNCAGTSLCRADLADGALICDQDTDCVSGHCDLSSAPGPETGRCCAMGDCCDFDVDCGAGSYCRASAWQCGSGALSDLCDDNNDCDPGNYCTGGFCALALADGDTVCDENSDCSSLHCDLNATGGSETGRCCDAGDCCDADTDCPGGYCRASTWQCVSGAVGQPCDDHLDCAAVNYCNGSNVCAARMANGTRICTANAMCLSNNCDTSNNPNPEIGRCCVAGDCCNADGDCAGFCRISTFQCVTGDPGAPCDDSADCNAGSTCRLSTSECVAGGDGDPCDSDDNCDSGLYCRLSTSQCVTGDVGAACDEDDDCDDWHCNSNTFECVSGLNGAPCADDLDCDAYCNSDTSQCVGGLSGDPCADGTDCASGLCIAYTCVGP